MPFASTMSSCQNHLPLSCSSSLLCSFPNTHILVHKVEATVPGHESGNLLSILDQLYSHTLANSRVRLFGFDSTVKGMADNCEKE